MVGVHISRIDLDDFSAIVNSVFISLQELLSPTAIEVGLNVIFIQGNGGGEICNCPIIVLQVHFGIASGKKAVGKFWILFDGRIIVFHGSMVIFKDCLDIATDIIGLRKV